MENIVAARSSENTCGTCSRWHFVMAHNNQYVGWCKVRRQHMSMKNSKEKACFDFKKRPIKQQPCTSD